MGSRVIRGRISRPTRYPDIFISHSAVDKTIARNLALDLALCGVDAWFDEWEIHPGENLHAVIPDALAKSTTVGVVITENFASSPWTRGELHQALASEKTHDRTKVLPLIFRQNVLSELADRAYIEMHGPDYYRGLFRLAAEIKGVSVDLVSASLDHVPTTLGTSCMISVVRALIRCGVTPRVIVNEDDYKFLTSLPKAKLLEIDGAVIPHPANLPELDELSPTLRALIDRLPERWRADVGTLVEFAQI